MAAKKTNTSRFNVLYLLLTLKKYSSASKPMSISELTAKTNDDFYKSFGPDDSEKGLNNSTVSRIMDALCLDPCLGYQNTPMYNYTDINNCGHNIYCVMESGNPEDPWVFYQSPKHKNERGAKKYYYYESVFSDAELTTLIDAVETYNYFSIEDISELVSKLLGLRPTSEYLDKYDEYHGKRLKDEDSLVLSNIDEFNRIIKAGQFATIEYCSYEFDEKSHQLQLEIRPKYPRTIRPLSMMWSNGYYYLIAQLKSGYAPANLRMDRIRDIIPCNPTPEMVRDFQVDIPLDSTLYRLRHPIMYGGELKHITMLYNSALSSGMNNIIMDTFGKMIHIRPATADEIETHIGKEHLDEPWLCAKLEAAEGGVELFATQYCRHCRIISPESLSEKVKNTLLEGLKLYPS